MKAPTKNIPVILWLVIFALLVVVLWLLGGLLQMFVIPYIFRIAMLSGIAIIAAVSLNIVNGYTGQFSIGHAGFMLVGAYASAGITVFAGDRFVSALRALHVPGPVHGPIIFAVAIMVGAVAAGLMGLVVGMPSLRLKGDYLAIATLGFAEAIRAVFTTSDAVGGASGLHNLPLYTNFAWIFGCAAAVIIFARGLEHSRHGRALLAIREDEVAAQAVGIPAFRYKVLAFVISSAWAGVAGALIAHYDCSISPGDFGFMKSFSVIVMVVFGGLGSNLGAVIAAMLLTWPTELMRFNPILSYYRMVIYPLLLIILMLVRPRGLFGRKDFSLRLGPVTADPEPAKEASE